MKARKESGRSLTWVLTVFIIAVLLNAAFLCFSGYLLAMRYGLMTEETMARPTGPLLILLSFFVLAIVLLIFFGGRKVRPIRRVNDAMRQVSKGDFSIRLDEKQCDGEFRELYRSYNHMVQELSGIELFRTDFINNFSHEFKTPIVSIRGFARQLERSDLTDEQRAEYTRIIVSESERLANMSTNVLLLTKLENQQIVTDCTEYSLDEQIRDCILLLEKQWEDKELELDLQLDEVTYNGNEEMMSHVWVNLINNAIKYSEKGGKLEINCMRVQDFIEVRITDHGEGMDVDTQMRIFEKFYQGDSAHAAEGNGLGLSLVKRIVDLCRGKIAVTSVPGQGSTFTVCLPVEKE